MSSGSNPEISIVMTYFERHEQFQTTLKSFAEHDYGPEVEVIVVDDGSVKEPAKSPEFAFRFNLKIVYLDPAKKWYTNPCVPFNHGIGLAKGSAIIIQNAECFHQSDIVAKVRTDLTEHNYLNFGCYSIDEATTKSLTNRRDSGVLSNGIVPLQRATKLDGECGWYNHSVFKPSGLHFCSAISRLNMDTLGGFDLKYAKGWAYDDNEFMERIKQMGLEFRIVDDTYVVHLYHYQNRKSTALVQKLMNRNRILFERYTKKHCSRRGFIAFFMDYHVLGPLNRILKTSFDLGKDAAKWFVRKVLKIN